MTETGLRASIVINTYNRAPYLRRLVPGLAHLRGGPFELVVVNGPSTDETDAVLQTYRERIKVVQCPSRNLSHSRNLGIAAAAGDIVVFIDDDALPGDVHWLARYLDVFMGDGADRVGAVGGPVWQGDSLHFEFNGGSTSDYGFQIFDVEKHDRATCDGEWVERVPGGNCAFRRTVLIRIGGFDEFFTYYHDDTDVCLRLARAGFSVRHLPGNGVRHYQAGSERRTSYFDRNWRVIARSDTYFALKNGADPLHRRVAKTVAAAPRKHYARQIMEWRRTGEISRRHWLRLVRQLGAGVASGFWSGLTRRRKLGDFRVAPPSFAPFSLPTTERPLRIALLSQVLPGQPGNGGVGRYTFDLARGLHERGHTVHLFCRSETPLARQSLEFVIHGISGSSAPLAGADDRPVLARNLSYALSVVRTLAQLEARGVSIDVVHASNWDCEAAALIRARIFPTVLMLVSPLARVIITEQWQRTRDLRACLLLDRWQIEQADTVCVPSSGVLEDYQGLMGLHPGSIRRLRRVPLGIFRDESRSAELAGRPRLLFVGRCERRKGVHTLLAVLPDLLTAHPEWECHFVGDDTVPMSDGRTLKERFFAEHRGAAWLARVIFHGAVSEEELRRHYRCCDLFVAPSLFESFGLIYHEAMQYGKAVVGCRTGGVPEVVEDGVEGLLVEPDSREELRSALSQLMRDPDLRRRMGEAGARRIRERSNYRAMAERMEGVYRETIEATAREIRPRREQLFFHELPLFTPSKLVDFHGEWVTQEAAPGHVYRIGRPGTSLSFTASPDCMLYVVALRHAWSGVLEILVGDAPPRYVDLYKAGQINLAYSVHFPVQGDGDGPVQIVLRVHSDYNPESQAGEVWLKQISLARLPHAEPSESPGQAVASEDAT